MVGDDEVDRPLTLCVFWPEDPQATFYLHLLQAHNAAARDDWLAKLRGRMPILVSMIHGATSGSAREE